MGINQINTCFTSAAIAAILNRSRIIAKVLKSHNELEFGLITSLFGKERKRHAHHKGSLNCWKMFKLIIFSIDAFFS